MFGIFKRKKKNSISAKHTNDNTAFNAEHQISAQPFDIQYDDKMKRLMELISKAMDDWAKEYNLENMPKMIIFQQALDAMRAIESVLTKEH